MIHLSFAYCLTYFCRIVHLTFDTESTTLHTLIVDVHNRAVGTGAWTRQNWQPKETPGLRGGYETVFQGLPTTWMLRLSGVETDASISSKVCSLLLYG